MKKSNHRSHMPVAAIPLFFGIQQLIEGGIWLSLGPDGSPLNAELTYAYSLFAFILWPVFVPFAVRSLERQLWRRKMLSVFQFAGVAVGAYLLYYHTASPVTSEVVNKSVVYNNSHFFGVWVIALYFVATIGSLLLSSNRVVNLFGVLAFVGALTAYGVYANSFISVWCFFAAILSIVMYAFVRGQPSEVGEAPRPWLSPEHVGP